MSDPHYREDQPFPVGTLVHVLPYEEIQWLFDRLAPETRKLTATVMPIGETTFHGLCPVVPDASGAPEAHDRAVDWAVQIEEVYLLRADLPDTGDLVAVERWLAE